MSLWSVRCQGGDEMTPEETIRLESEINHALETLGISDDYMGEMLDHLRMTVEKLGIDMQPDVEYDEPTPTDAVDNTEEDNE